MLYVYDLKFFLGNLLFFLFFFQAEDGIRDGTVTGVQTCALPISVALSKPAAPSYRHGLEHLGDYAALLLKREPGEHREREHMGRGLLGDGEVTPTEAESLVGLREVKDRKSVV